MLRGSPSSEAASGPIWIVMVATTIILIVAAAIALRPAPPPPEQSVAAILENDRDTRAWIIAMRTHYPDQYRTMLARLAPIHAGQGRSAVRLGALHFVQAHMATKLDAIASAPDRYLERLLEIDLARIRAFRDEDVRLCAMFATGARGRPPASPAEMQRLSRAFALTIAAARAGEISGRRPRGPPSQADQDALGERAIAIEPSLAWLIRAGSRRPATPDQQCRSGLAIQQALTELPPGVGATFMARSKRLSRGAVR